MKRTVGTIVCFIGCILGAQVQERNDKCLKMDFVSRDEWNARPPFRTFPMVLPVSHVIVMHTHNESTACETLYECERNLQFIQDDHMDNHGWWDIAYSFLIGGDGRVYEGVGWKYAAEHTVNYNTISIGVAFMGNFNNEIPPEKMINACKYLIECGITKGYLTPSVRVSGHRDATCTKSPGDRIYEIIKQWPNFMGGRLPLYHCDVKVPTKIIEED